MAELEIVAVALYYLYALFGSVSFGYLVLRLTYPEVRVFTDKEKLGASALIGYFMVIMAVVLDVLISGFGQVAVANGFMSLFFGGVLLLTITVFTFYFTSNPIQVKSIAVPVSSTPERKTPAPADADEENPYAVEAQAGGYSVLSPRPLSKPASPSPSPVPSPSLLSPRPAPALIPSSQKVETSPGRQWPSMEKTTEKKKGIFDSFSALFKTTPKQASAKPIPAAAEMPKAQTVPKPMQTQAPQANPKPLEKKKSVFDSLANLFQPKPRQAQSKHVPFTAPAPSAQVVQTPTPTPTQVSPASQKILGQKKSFFTSLITAILGASPRKTPVSARPSNLSQEKWPAESKSQAQSPDPAVRDVKSPAVQTSKQELMGKSQGFFESLSSSIQPAKKTPSTTQHEEKKVPEQKKVVIDLTGLFSVKSRDELNEARQKVQVNAPLKEKSVEAKDEILSWKSTFENEKKPAALATQSAVKTPAYEKYPNLSSKATAQEKPMQKKKGIFDSLLNLLSAAPREKKLEKRLETVKHLSSEASAMPAEKNQPAQKMQAMQTKPNYYSRQEPHEKMQTPFAAEKTQPAEDKDYLVDVSPSLQPSVRERVREKIILLKQKGIIKADAEIEIPAVLSPEEKMIENESRQSKSKKALEEAGEEEVEEVIKDVRLLGEAKEDFASRKKEEKAKAPAEPQTFRHRLYLTSQQKQEKQDETTVHAEAQKPSKAAEEKAESASKPGAKPDVKAPAGKTVDSQKKAAPEPIKPFETTLSLNDLFSDSSTPQAKETPVAPAVTAESKKPTAVTLPAAEKTPDAPAPSSLFGQLDSVGKAPAPAEQSSSLFTQLDSISTKEKKPPAESVDVKVPPKSVSGCPNCNAKTSKVVFCPYCGTAMCANCSPIIKPVEDGFIYSCPSCLEEVHVKRQSPGQMQNLSL